MTAAARPPARLTAAPAPLRIGDTLFEWGSRTYVMGVINATPDSFSGDGVLDPSMVAARACAMVEDGASLIDVGAESSRPGRHSVDADEEWGRLGPVLRAVRAAVAVPVTVDTTKAAVAERAFDAGADALNDINGLRGDSDLAALLGRRGCPALLMHNQRGRGFSGDVIADIAAGLEVSLAIAKQAGLSRDAVMLDPGFGFGWEVEQNLEMLRRLAELKALGRPLLIGTSRKSTIGAVLGRPEGERRWGTAATVALAAQAGVDIVRVHDVREMADVARMADAVARGTVARERS
ncbi:MAG: dihydropteroate synthase [Dehalococcoidia bacterium]|jgi:dihydropteroate synthase|nr:dihydropteroate synthase [Dehalococcoidia bacterium]